MTKTELRALVRARLAGIPAADWKLRSPAAAAAVSALPEFKAAHCVMIYLAMPGEAVADAIAEEGWRQSKLICAPRTNWEHFTLSPAPLSDLEQSVQVGPRGIREPLDPATVPVGQLDLIITPGLAFDAHGRRLGRGGGFFDRLLGQREWRGVAIGFGLDEQLEPEIPVAPHDACVNIVVTDRRVIRCRPR